MTDRDWDGADCMEGCRCVTAPGALATEGCGFAGSGGCSRALPALPGPLGGSKGAGPASWLSLAGSTCAPVVVPARLSRLSLAGLPAGLLARRPAAGPARLPADSAPASGTSGPAQALLPAPPRAGTGLSPSGACAVTVAAEPSAAVLAAACCCEAAASWGWEAGGAWLLSGRFCGAFWACWGGAALESAAAQPGGTSSAAPSCCGAFWACCGGPAQGSPAAASSVSASRVSGG